LENQKVFGRDEVLLGIERRAIEYGDTIVQDVRNVMHDYEVDMYRLVMSIGKRYGMDTAYEIMSDTVADKRLKWLDQIMPKLDLQGSEIEKGLTLYLKYFKCKDEDLKITARSNMFITFKRKDFIGAIAHACTVLGLDVIEVNNKVYARAMNMMFERVNLRIKHSFSKAIDGWYEETLEVIS